MKTLNFDLYRFRGELYAIRKEDITHHYGIHLTGPEPRLVYCFFALTYNNWICKYYNEILNENIEFTDILKENVCFIARKRLSFEDIKYDVY